MDRFDRQILNILRDEGRLSWSELGERISLSPSATQRRVTSLIDQGVITGFHARFDTQKLGYEVRGLVEVNIDRSNQELAKDFRNYVQESPEVLSCYMVSGGVDYVLEVVAKDLTSYAAFIENHILVYAGVKDASSKIVLRTIKRHMGPPAS